MALAQDPTMFVAQCKEHVTALKDERERRMKAAGITGIIDGGGQPEQIPCGDDRCADMFPELLEEVSA